MAASKIIESFSYDRNRILQQVSGLTVNVDAKNSGVLNDAISEIAQDLNVSKIEVWDARTEDVGDDENPMKWLDKQNVFEYEVLKSYETGDDGIAGLYAIDLFKNDDDKNLICMAQTLASGDLDDLKLTMKNLLEKNPSTTKIAVWNSLELSSIAGRSWLKKDGLEEYDIIPEIESEVKRQEKNAKAEFYLEPPRHMVKARR